MECCFWTVKKRVRMEIWGWTDDGFVKCDKPAESHWMTPLGTVLSYCREHRPLARWGGLKPATEQEAQVAEVHEQ